MSGENILEVQNLTKHFKISGKQIVHAVDGVSFTLQKGKTLGLVGESGCGKSTCARTDYPDVRCDRREDPAGRGRYYQSEAKGAEASAQKMQMSFRIRTLR